MEYTTIAKGRGFVYAHDRQLYYHVRTAGSTKYMKCTTCVCDGSAKLTDDQFVLGVSALLSNQLVVIATAITS